MLVGRLGGEDHVRDPACRDFKLARVEDADEPFRSAALHVAGDDHEDLNVKRGKGRGRPVHL